MTDTATPSVEDEVKDLESLYQQNETKVLVCGGRNFNDYTKLSDVLDRFVADFGIGCIIEGGAKGADALARHWAEDNRVCYIEVPAQWDNFGKAAGMLRNEWMIKYCDPQFVIAFPTQGSKGTWGMISLAKLQAIPVLVIED